jgi:hypothetical protein
MWINLEPEFSLYEKLFTIIFLSSSEGMLAAAFEVALMREAGCAEESID